MPLGRRPTATSTLSKTADSGALPPSNDTVSPSGPASTLVTLVLTQMFSYRLLTHRVSGLTRSASAPGMSWSSSSTTLTFEPSS